MKKLVIFICLLSSILTSCKKSETIDLHMNHVDSLNHIPPYSGVSTLICQNYVNKLYVDLLSREPSETELNQAVSALRSGNYDTTAKRALINSLVGTRSFYQNLFIKSSNRILNSISKSDIQDEINFEAYLISYYTTLNDFITVNALIVQSNNLKKLYESDSLLQLGQININQYYYRFLYNNFYDQINMGSENFVKATFQDLFFRQPTDAEKNAGVQMVDGGSAIVLSAAGSSKGDFVTIATNSNSFYEGMITEAYLTYLLRKPTDQEVNNRIQGFAVSRDYIKLISDILISQEYAGF